MAFTMSIFRRLHEYPRSTTVYACGLPWRHPDSIDVEGCLLVSALFNYPAVTRCTNERLAGLVRLHCQRIFEYSTLGVKNCIHAELLRLARNESDLDGEVVIHDPPTHVELANRVATHREAVTRECKHMEALGIIEWRPGRHVIKDVTALERMVKEVQGR